MKDYNKNLCQDDFPSWEDYMLTRVKRGLDAGYTFQECYEHWLEDFSNTLHRLSDQLCNCELHGQPTHTAPSQ